MTRRKKWKAILMALNMTAILSGCSLPENATPETTIEETNENDATLSLYNNYLEKIGSPIRLTKEDLKIISEKMNGEIARIILRSNDGTYYPTFRNFGDIVEDRANKTIYLINNTIYEPDQNFKLDEFSWQAVPNIEYNRIATLGNYIDKNNIESIGYIPTEWNFWNGQYKPFILENYGSEVLECLEKYGYPASVYEIKDFYATYHLKRWTENFELPETTKVLNTYNAYLKSIGSAKALTEKDIEFIYTGCSEQRKMMSIKTNNSEYTQVGYNEYQVVENANEEIRVLVDSTEPQVDFLTGEELPLNETFEGYTKIANLGEYMKENKIQPIGYTLIEGWSTQEVKFILENYDEEILDCLKVNGFPIEVYQANDFYNAHRNEKYNIDFGK